jgi:hypothetical protein
VRNWREKYKERRLWNDILKEVKTHQGFKSGLKRKRNNRRRRSRRRRRREEVRN